MDPKCPKEPKGITSPPVKVPRKFSTPLIDSDVEAVKKVTKPASSNSNSKRKPGRPKGTKDKKPRYRKPPASKLKGQSYELLKTLEDEYNFFVIPELLELYYRFLKAKDFNQCKQILLKMLEFIYPKQKAMEISGAVGEQINLNFNIPDVNPKKKESLNLAGLRPANIIELQKK